MNTVVHLVKGDMKQFARDPMLAFYLLGPFALMAALRFGIPFVAGLLQREMQFDLSAYYDLIMSVALLLIPLILGCMAGFMMLDERDENIIQYFAVTPLSKRGYVWYRLALAIVLTVVYSTLMLSFVGLTPLRIGNTILLLSMMALEAPIFALFMAAFASNKVEGLALSKGVSLFIFAPFIAYFVHSPWQYAGGIVPAFWVAKTFLAGSTASFSACALIALAGDLVHMLLLRYLFRRFMMKPD